MIRITIGLLCLLFGAFGWFTQLISWTAPALARRLGFQEGERDTDPLYRTAEWWTALWDTLVLWTLAAAGLLIMVRHPFAPWLSLIAAGILLDAGGREAAKYAALRRSGVRTGTPAQLRRAAAAYLSMILLSLILLTYTLLHLPSP